MQRFSMKKHIFYFAAILMLFISTINEATAQHYKLRQTSNMMGMKTEKTIYVKGMRKRTEDPGMMGMTKNLVTIEQCDLQRTVKLNTKKQLYFIEPFATGNDEVIDDDAVTNKKTVIPPKKNVDNPDMKKGGVITMWYSINDTNERKQMYGFTARHVWTSQKMKPSADACMMKDSMEIKTDGWYIDLPQFNCPVHYKPAQPPRQQNEQVQPQCTDRFVTHRRGKGKLGFPLIETTTIKMGNANPQMSEFKTDIETLELTTTKLDSMLFEIPPGYQLAASEEDLQDKLTMKEMQNNAMEEAKKGNIPTMTSQEKKPDIIRIGVFAPTGDDQVEPGFLQLQMVGALHNDKVEGIAVATDEEARKYNCDYTLNTVFTKIKQAAKLGGILKAIKNANPTGTASYNISAGMILKTMADGSIKSQPSIDGKYDGKVDAAAGMALTDGCKEVMKVIK